MNLKTTVLAAAAALILTPAAAMAATEQFPIQVTVEATVPSATGLQISPVGDWAGQTQNACAGTSRPSAWIRSCSRST